MPEYYCASCFNVVAWCDCHGELPDYDHFMESSGEFKKEDEIDDGVVWYFLGPIGLIREKTGDLGLWAALRQPLLWTTTKPADGDSRLSIPQSRLDSMGVGVHRVNPVEEGGSFIERASPFFQNTYNGIPKPWNLEFYDLSIDNDKIDSVLLDVRQNCLKKKLGKIFLRACILIQILKYGIGGMEDIMAFMEPILPKFIEELDGINPIYILPFIMTGWNKYIGKFFKHLSLKTGKHMNWVHQFEHDLTDPVDNQYDESTLVTDFATQIIDGVEDNGGLSSGFDTYGGEPQASARSITLGVLTIPPAPALVYDSDEEPPRPPRKPPSDPETPPPETTDPPPPRNPPPTDVPPVEPRWDVDKIGFMEAAFCISQRPDPALYFGGYQGSSNYDIRLSPHIGWGAQSTPPATGAVYDPAITLVTPTIEVGSNEEAKILVKQCYAIVYQMRNDANQDPFFIISLSYVSGDTSARVKVFFTQADGSEVESTEDIAFPDEYACSCDPGYPAGITPIGVRFQVTHQSELHLETIWRLRLQTIWDPECLPVYQRASNLGFNLGPATTPNARYTLNTALPAQGSINTSSTDSGKVGNYCFTPDYTYSKWRPPVHVMFNGELAKNEFFFPPELPPDEAVGGWGELQVTAAGDISFSGYQYMGYNTGGGGLTPASVIDYLGIPTIVSQPIIVEGTGYRIYIQKRRGSFTGIYGYIYWSKYFD